MATQKAREVGLLTAGGKLWHAGHSYDFLSENDEGKSQIVGVKTMSRDYSFKRANNFGFAYSLLLFYFINFHSLLSPSFYYLWVFCFFF